MGAVDHFLDAAAADLQAAAFPEGLRALALDALDKIRRQATDVPHFHLVQFPVQVHASLGGSLRTLRAPIVACILLHAAADLLDDAQDGDLVGRAAAAGWPQVVLASQALVALALQIGGSWEAPPEDVVRLGQAIARTLHAMAGGQHLDLLNVDAAPVSLADYELAVLGKTGASARLYAEAGAIAAGASREDTEAAATFGEQMGIASQYLSDTVGAFERRGSDLRNRKRTLPLLLAGATSGPFPEGDEALDRLLTPQVRTACLERIDGHRTAALEALDRLPANVHTAYLHEWCFWVTDERAPVASVGSEAR